MKVEDLMVGDWVYITEHPMKKEAKQVKPEHFLRSLVTFEPIPLTLEILEKNFTMYDLEYFIPEYPSHNPEANDYFSIYHDRCSGLSTIWKTEYIDGFYSDVETKFVSVVSIKYVHELQHFLKSCMINKEIKL